MPRTTRRDLLAAGAGLALAGCAAPPPWKPEDSIRARPPECKPQAGGASPLRLGVVATAYYYLSHAYHICGRFLDGYIRNGVFHHPRRMFRITGMHVEQQKQNDLSKELADKHGFKLYPDVAGALTAGTDALAVDGVLLIGEHGDYPNNAKGQKQYPRYELFQKIVEVFKKTGKSVPVFNDKHLSYDRKKGAEMVATAESMGFPLMAGSSLPVTWRRPELELPLGVGIKEALVASRGDLEIFGIHSLEALQCMVERRVRDGNQGVKAVQCLEGDAVFKAGDEGVWSWELLEHALSRSYSLNVGDVRQNTRHYRPRAGSAGTQTVRTGGSSLPNGPAAFVIDYRDGLRATVLVLNGHIDDTCFAARIEGERRPVSTLFYLPPPPGARFLEALTMRIEDFLSTGKPPYPVERTQLTGGILDCALDSRVAGHARIETPDLDIRYDPPADSGFVRGSWDNPM